MHPTNHLKARMKTHRAASSPTTLLSADAAVTPTMAAAQPTPPPDEQWPATHAVDENQA